MSIYVTRSIRCVDWVTSRCMSSYCPNSCWDSGYSCLGLWIEGGLPTTTLGMAKLANNAYYRPFDYAYVSILISIVSPHPQQNAQTI